MEKEEYQSKKDRIIDNLRFLLLASLLNFIVHIRFHMVAFGQRSIFTSNSTVHILSLIHI